MLEACDNEQVYLNRNAESCIFSDYEIKINFCGVDFYEDFLRLKFYWFNLMEEDIEIYVYNLKADNKSLFKIKTLGKVSGCEYEYLSIDVRMKDLSNKEQFSMEFELIELLEEYEFEWVQKINIIFDIEQQAYQIVVKECLTPGDEEY